MNTFTNAGLLLAELAIGGEGAEVDLVGRVLARAGLDVGGARQALLGLNREGLAVVAREEGRQGLPRRVWELTADGRERARRDGLAARALWGRGRSCRASRGRLAWSLALLGRVGMTEDEAETEIGVDAGTIARAVAGEEGLGLGAARELARIAGVSAGWLVTGDGVACWRARRTARGGGHEWLMPAAGWGSRDHAASWGDSREVWRALDGAPGVAVAVRVGERAAERALARRESR